MEVQAPFGFVTGCHAGDRFMAQATLASMRHFCPAIPICLIVDGDFDVSDLEIQYDLSILRISDLPSEVMRKTIGGNYRAKLAAMWEGPFEFYVWLDSDAIVWGDFTDLVRRNLDFHIFWKEAARQETAPAENGFKHFYFDPELLKRYDDQFRWENNTYFCSGTFACRRDAITFEEWLELEDWGRETEGLFAWGEMGMLNYLVHSKAQRDELRIDSSDLQQIWAHHGRTELQRDCRGTWLEWPNNIRRPRVAHFCYRKPYLYDLKSYSHPFTIARVDHYRRSGKSQKAAFARVVSEDAMNLLGRAKQKLLRIGKQPNLH